MTVASNPAVGGENFMASLPTETFEVLRDYLDRAPDELTEWAQSQKAVLASLEEQREGGTGSADPGSVASTSTSGSAGPEAKEPGSVPVGPTPGVAPATDSGDSEDDESEDFYNDMEGEDDILQRRRTPGYTRALSAAKRGKASHGSVRKEVVSATPEDAASSGGDTGTESAGAETAGAAGIATAPRRGWVNLSAGGRVALIVLLIAGIIGGVKLASQTGDASRATATTPSIGTDGPDINGAARIAELTAAIERNPDSIEERLELGVLYFNDRRIEEAQELWLEVTELAPDDATAWYNLGFSYLSMQPAQTDAAREAWQRVVDLDPESEMALTVAMHMQGLDMPAPEQDPTG